MIDDLDATTPRLTTLCVVDDGLITASMIKRMVFVRYNLSREYSRSTLTFSGFVTPPPATGPSTVFHVVESPQRCCHTAGGGQDRQPSEPFLCRPHLRR